MNLYRAPLLTLLTCLMVAASPSRNTGTNELQTLCGAWRLVSTVDEKQTDRGSGDCRMAIHDDATVVLRIGSLTTNQGTLRIGRSGGLRLIDMHLSTGTILGVYEQRGDDLVICCDWQEKGRPGAMTPKGSQWLETWRRVAP